MSKRTHRVLVAVAAALAITALAPAGASAKSKVTVMGRNILESPAVFGDARLTMRDVILRNTASKHIRVTGTASANFATKLLIPTFAGPITVLRGWTAADLNVSGEPFRFVNTHLEAFHPGIRAGQAGELVAPGGPAAGAGSIVLVGDMNSDPNGSAPGNIAFNILAGAGFADTWVEANPGDPGFTSGFGELVNDSNDSGFDSRIDHVLTRGVDKRVDDSTLVGRDPANRTDGGLWPSDHAGVVAELKP